MTMVMKMGQHRQIPNGYAKEEQRSDPVSLGFFFFNVQFILVAVP